MPVNILQQVITYNQVAGEQHEARLGGRNGLQHAFQHNRIDPGRIR